jgi:hypothetical protein
MIEASPKSESPTIPNRLTKMFAGLMSRCKMPEAWAAASASASLRPMSRTCPAGIGPCLRSVSLSEPAGHSSITMNGRPSPRVPAS